MQALWSTNWNTVMDNYFARLLRIDPSMNQRSLNLEHTPRYEGEGYEPPQPMYQQPAFGIENAEGWAGADNKGHYFGGMVSGYVPTKNGTISGSLAGSYSNYGKPIPELKGAGLNFNKGNVSVGFNYNQAPVQLGMMPDYYSNPSYQEGALQPDFANSEYFDNLYRYNSNMNPTQNFLARGTVRY